MYLLRGKREVTSLLGVLENYEREHGKFANLSNTTEIRNKLYDVIPLLEKEIDTAERYEEWLEGGIEKVYVVFGKRISDKGKITKYRWIKAFKSHKRAEEYKEELGKPKEYTKYEVQEVPIG